MCKYLFHPVTSWEHLIVETRVESPGDVEILGRSSSHEEEPGWWEEPCWWEESAGVSFAAVSFLPGLVPMLPNLVLDTVLRIPSPLNSKMVGFFFVCLFFVNAKFLPKTLRISWGALTMQFGVKWFHPFPSICRVFGTFEKCFRRGMRKYVSSPGNSGPWSQQPSRNFPGQFSVLNANHLH